MGENKPDISDTFVIGLLIFLFAVVASGGLLAGYSIGHRQGVGHGISGKYVIVNLPDGTKQVCRDISKD